MPSPPKVPFAQAYGFAQAPEHCPLWAAGLSSALHRNDAGWVVPTPQGDAIDFNLA